jgi:hypothetical protein
MNQDKFPSLFQQANNLIHTIKDAVVSDEDLFITEQIQNERMSICRTCDSYNYLQKRCRECGCFLEHKVKLTVATCPLQKW